MNQDSYKKMKLKVKGMHCQSCEVLIERKLKKFEGVERVNVNHASGHAELLCSCEPKLEDLNKAIKEHGYELTHWDDSGETEKPNYIQAGAIFLVIMSLYLIFKEVDILPKLTITDGMSLSFIFLIGLVAAGSSCLAVTGGLLLAVSAKWSENMADLSAGKKLAPYLFFNAGRLAGYTFFGAAVGALGSILSISTKTTGFLTIAISLVMIFLGLRMLNLFPWLTRFKPRLPKFLTHRIHDLSESKNRAAPFALGALTFFLPCGFTQALQLYVLSQGDPIQGGLTMLMFSLGTLPALLSLSALSTFLKGSFHRVFVKFAGALVILIGIASVQNGLLLTGTNVNLASALGGSKETSIEIVDGKQIAEMKVIGLQYDPARFTVKKGVPVEWRINGARAVGCGQVIVIPDLNIMEVLSPTETTVITFTPTETGKLPFTCTMGMTYGEFKVTS